MAAMIMMMMTAVFGGQGRPSAETKGRHGSGGSEANPARIRIERSQTLFDELGISRDTMSIRSSYCECMSMFVEVLVVCLFKSNGGPSPEWDL